MKQYILYLILLSAGCTELAAQSAWRPSLESSADRLSRIDIATGGKYGVYTGWRPYRLDRSTESLWEAYTDASISERTIYDIEWLGYEMMVYDDLKRAQRISSHYGPIEEGGKWYGYTDTLRKAPYRTPLYADDGPYLGFAYDHPAHVISYQGQDVSLTIDPLLQIGVYRGGSSDGTLFENQRGVELSGRIDNRVYFSTALYDNQARFPEYVKNYINQYGAVPGAGKFKRFKSVLVDLNDGYDYLLARGFLGVDISDHISIELGHDRRFIGHGMRSLLIGDMAPEYFYLQLQAQVWKFQYSSLVTELTAQSPRNQPGNPLLPKKYMTSHYLEFKPGNRWSVGIFESVVFSRSNQFELQYLNPVIFYRAIESAIGSADNVLLGLNAQYIPAPGIQIYGQLVADEFKLDELITERRGWWANKIGWQVGLRVLDVAGLSGLDAQLEYNTVRPYTYSHRDTISNYSHYNQPLAHPLGANFREGLLRLSWSGPSRWSAEQWLSYSQQGRDPAGENLGGNILLANAEIGEIRPFGNSTAQGLRSNVLTLSGRLSYRLWHQLHLDLHYLYRRDDGSADRVDPSTGYVGAGIRWRMNRRALFL